MNKFDLSKFIKDNIIFRDDSFFQSDILRCNNELLYRISGKRILVIGGGGTIGSNFIKSILRYDPATIVVVDSNENALTELVRSIRSDLSIKTPKELITYPINFSDPIFYKIYSYYKPFDIIANFAAHKHVRSEKDIFSIQAMIQNNVIAAYDFLSTVVKDKPDFLFCVSTDKAANPVSLMGASKKVMEGLVLYFSKEANLNTARFANVAFSNGSLLESFLKRLEQRQPIAVPRDVKRFFVSAPESGEICMLSCMLGAGGNIFFPKLDAETQVYFYDIVKPFLNANGYDIKECYSEDEAKESVSLIDKGIYPVYSFESNTDGEKLYEEFYTESEHPILNKFDSLGVIDASPHMTTAFFINNFIEEYKAIFMSNELSKRDIVDFFSKYVPDFKHIETGFNLDKKM